MTSDAVPFDSTSRLEADLRHYRELFEGAPDGYAVTDAHGVILQGNRTLAGMLGVHPRFLERKLLLNFVTRGDVRRFRASLARLASGEGDRELVTVSLRPRHGQPPFVAELSARLVRGAGERVTSIRWGVRMGPARAERPWREDGAPSDGARSDEEIVLRMLHDLRALLRTVQTAGGAIVRGLTRGSAEAIPLLREIQRASERMLHLARESFESLPDGSNHVCLTSVAASVGVRQDEAERSGMSVAHLLDERSEGERAKEKESFDASQRPDDRAPEDDPA